MPDHGSGTAKLLNYRLHFSLLVATIAGIAAAGASRPRLGLSAAALYGGLHALLLAVTLRQAQPRGRRLCFVAAGAAVCAVNAALCLRAGAVVTAVFGARGMAALLAAVSAGGAVAYAIGLGRCFSARLAPGSLAWLAMGCAAAALAAVATGLYSAAGGFGLAASWWVAMSLGLWWRDRCGAVKLLR